MFIATACASGVRRLRIGSVTHLDVNGNLRCPSSLLIAGGRRGTPKIWDGSQWVYYSDLGAFDIDEQLEAN